MTWTIQMSPKTRTDRTTRMGQTTWTCQITDGLNDPERDDDPDMPNVLNGPDDPKGHITSQGSRARPGRPTIHVVGPISFG